MKLEIEKLNTFIEWKVRLSEIEEFIKSKQSKEEYKSISFGSAQGVYFNEEDYIKYIQLMEKVNLARQHLDEEINFRLKPENSELRQELFDKIMMWYMSRKNTDKGVILSPITESAKVLVDDILILLSKKNDTKTNS